MIVNNLVYIAILIYSIVYSIIYNSYRKNKVIRQQFKSYQTINDMLIINNNRNYWYNIIFIIYGQHVVNSLVYIAIVIYSIMYNSFRREKQYYELLFFINE